jgi:hypothetical protein
MALSQNNFTHYHLERKKLALVHELVLIFMKLKKAANRGRAILVGLLRNQFI